MPRHLVHKNSEGRDILSKFGAPRRKPCSYHQTSEGIAKMDSSADQSNPCAICLSGMGAGGGQAIFTAECSHTFHFQCISASVAHGNHVCPLCNAQWIQLPFLRPTQPSPPPRPRLQPIHRVQPPSQPVVVEPETFDDDDEVVVETSADRGSQGHSEATPGGTLVVRTHTEYSAIARGSPHENFAAVVHVKAPGLADGEGDARRAPLDLVTVLDVSGSMSGEKLALLKQAMGFVIDNLGPGDRLSVVSFSSEALRVTRLLRMSDTGKGLTKTSVESLVARGGTNIAEGLRMAAKVLDERRHRNAVSSVILLSDGQDNYTMPMRPRAQGPAPNYEALVPASFTRSGPSGGAGSEWTAPIHTFGFGNDHDAAAMHVIAEATGGTFSFIENEAVIQDSFAQCIGGLLTVVVQEARIAVACEHPRVRVNSVKSGRYESRIDEDGRSASVYIGELYADEERRFLVFLGVPPVEADDDTETTTLIKVRSSYRDAVSGAGVNVTAEDTVVMRPQQVAVDAERSMEVARERVRVEATDDIAAARAAAELGAYQDAVDILENRQRAVAESEAALGGDPMSLALGRELQEMRARVASRESYTRSGRAFMLAGFNMHSAQRANSRELRSEGASVVPARSTAAAWEAPSYATQAMRAMLLRSRVSREVAAQQQPQADAGEAAGSSGPNNSPSYFV